MLPRSVARTAALLALVCALPAAAAQDEEAEPVGLEPVAPGTAPYSTTPATETDPPGLQDGPTVAEVVEAAAESENPFVNWLAEGKLDLNVRLRYSYADIRGLDVGNAVTLRTRAGYTTGTLAGFQAAIQFEDNRALVDEYNAAGLNNEPTRSIIADPEDTELNQAWISYDFADAFDLGEDTALAAKVGRQRIILDDARFVGNVGWRNLEQTYDAGRVDITAGPVDLFYAYVQHVNRIFGPDADRDFDGDIHLVNATLGTPLGALTGFAYLLDFDDALALSSQTYGVRLAGTKPLGDGDDAFKFGYAASYAFQSDYGDNPTEYDANYVLGEIRLISPGGIFGGVGFELLGSDDGVAAFQTPLGTNHKFNGFADVFLVTPADGLRDYYAFVGTKLPAPLKGKFTVFYHEFEGDESGDDFGWEIDAVATHKFASNLTGLVKYAYYQGEDAFADRDRLTVQLELTF